MIVAKILHMFQHLLKPNSDNKETHNSFQTEDNDGFTKVLTKEEKKSQRRKKTTKTEKNNVTDSN